MHFIYEKQLNSALCKIQKLQQNKIQKKILWKWQRQLQITHVFSQTTMNDGRITNEWKLDKKIIFFLLSKEFFRLILHTHQEVLWVRHRVCSNIYKKNNLIMLYLGLLMILINFKLKPKFKPMWSYHIHHNHSCQIWRLIVILTIFSSKNIRLTI